MKEQLEGNRQYDGQQGGENPLERGLLLQMAERLILLAANSSLEAVIDRDQSTNRWPMVSTARCKLLPRVRLRSVTPGSCVVRRACTHRPWRTLGGTEPGRGSTGTGQEKGGFLPTRGHSVGCHADNARGERAGNIGHAAILPRPRLSGRRRSVVAAARSHRKSPGEADVFTGERRRVGEQGVQDGFALVAHVLDGVGQVGRVPINDGGDHQVQPRHPELLCFLAAVGDAALLERADHLGQGVPLFALVQAGLAALAQSGRLEVIASVVMQTTLRVNGPGTVIMPPSCPARD